MTKHLQVQIFARLRLCDPFNVIIILGYGHESDVVTAVGFLDTSISVKYLLAHVDEPFLGLSTFNHSVAC